MRELEHVIGRACMLAENAILDVDELPEERLIFDSSVDRGIPSLAAAPEGPSMRPLQSARAASTISTSRVGSVESPSRGGRDSADSSFCQPAP